MNETTEKPNKARLLTMPATSSATAPKPPAWLRGEAKRYWRQHEDELARRGLLDDFTVMFFAIVCSCWASWFAISRQIQKDGITVPGPGGRPVVHPLLAAQARELKLFRMLAKDMGLMPKSRRTGTS
jgi:P27 family predicted phage terminase small subunit